MRNGAWHSDVSRRGLLRGGAPTGPIAVKGFAQGSFTAGSNGTLKTRVPSSSFLHEQTSALRQADVTLHYTTALCPANILVL